MEEGFEIVDQGFVNMFYKEHYLATVEHDENGNVLYLTDENGHPIADSHGNPQPLYHYLTPEEEKHLQKGSDGKVHVFLNGIFNSPDEAAGNAVQMAVNKNGHLYFTYHPEAKDTLVEIGIAVYKYLGGWSNSSKKFQDFITRYGNDEAIVSAHSRGSLTVGNGMRDFEKRGIHNIAGNTSINLFGPAYNAQLMANTLDYLSDGKQTSVGLENHAYDFVGIKFGGNPATFDQIPSGSSPGIEALRILTTYPTVHACYGHASRECRWRYGSSHRIQINSIKSGGKK